MFLVKANTSMLIEVPREIRDISWSGWQAYKSKEDRLYEKHEVFDAISVFNNVEMPNWIHRNITYHGYTVLSKHGRFALIRPKNIEFVD